MSELVAYERNADLLSQSERRRWIALMQPAAELAASIAGTDFVPGAIRNNPAAIAACILYGDEVGLGPMQSLAKIHVVDGRPGLSAEAARALILGAGHDLWIEEQTVTKATVAGKRRDSAQTSRVTWTIDDAKRARLAGKPNWTTYPRQMLAARATAELARLIFADVIGGLAFVDELDDGFSPEQAPTREARLPSKDDASAKRRRPQTTLSRSSRVAPARSEDEREEPPLPGEPGYDEEEADTDSPSWKRMHATFREAGYVERPRRIAFASEVVQRPLSSTKELRPEEIALVLNALGDVLAREQASASEDTDVRFDAPETSAEDVPETLSGSVSLAIFRARCAGEGITKADVARVGSNLFPERSLEALTSDELGELLDALLAELPPREEE